MFQVSHINGPYLNRSDVKHAFDAATTTYSKFILHGLFKRHKLYGSRVGSCFCIHQDFQEGAFSTSKVSMAEIQTGRQDALNHLGRG